MARTESRPQARGGGRTRAAKPVLQVRDLHVYYGRSHALQGVDLELVSGVLAVVGRNGMGKTTLCDAIAGLRPAARGAVRLDGEDVLGEPSHRIAARGLGYCPQGRRLWKSLTVDEHLKLAASGKGSWTPDRVYDTFPRLAERRTNGGAQLSGGEQQMLAIGRALLQDPTLLVLDEPTEGLAPVIVDQVEALLSALGDEGDVAVLLIEQNIAVATSVADDVAIMVNGRITDRMPAATLAGDRELQQRLLGVGRGAHDEPGVAAARPERPAASGASVANGASVAPEPRGETGPADSTDGAAPAASDFGRADPGPVTRWSSAGGADPVREDGRGGATVRPFDRPVEPPWKEPDGGRIAGPGGETIVAGTFDTKGAELRFLRERLAAAGVRSRSVDLSTSGRPSSADVPPHLVAAYHPRGASAVFGADRGASVAAMTLAFERWIARQPTPAGAIGAGGSGGTALVAPAFRSLPIGVPKVLVSTVASGDVGPYVGASDILMMYSVTDVAGLNRISREVLGNAAHALAGMVRSRVPADGDRARPGDEPAVGLTMFGVTTVAVRRLAERLEPRAECLVFHATGTGGRSMEKLADSGMLDAAIDLTTTEVCDLLMGGVFAATEDRLGAFARTRIPYVGSVGALDMVNFGAPDTVPERYRGRRFVEHNPQVTLMRTTVDENAAMGAWLAERLNRMDGPVRFVVPERGVSALDAPGEAFHDPEADAALFEALSENVVRTGQRRLEFVPHHVNDPGFTDAVLRAFDEVAGARFERRPVRAS